MAEEQHEGVFSRLNADLLKKGLGDGQIVSVIGTIQSNDGQNASLTCADGGIIQLSVNPDFDGQPGKAYEIMGAPQGDTMEAFISRDLGENFDMDLYNDMISKVWTRDNAKYSTYFYPK